MGRIKTRFIKRTTLELMKKHGDKVKRGFEEQKAFVAGHAKMTSKRVRNVIAGYAARLSKKKDY